MQDNVYIFFTFFLSCKMLKTNACSELLHFRVAVVRSFLAVVYLRCGLNLAVATPWKKQGEAGILVWLALFLARGLRQKYTVVHTLGSNNTVLYSQTHSVADELLKIGICLRRLLLLPFRDLFVLRAVYTATPK